MAATELSPYHRFKLTNWRLAPALTLGVILVICAALWSRADVRPLSEYDQTFYIGIAYDLRTTGRFTDGFGFATADAGQIRPSGMRFSPLYPALVAVAMAFDSNFAHAVDCVVHSNAKDAACPAAAGLIRLMQFLMLAVFFLIVWWVAREVLCSSRAGLIALAIAAMTAPVLLRFVNYVMTEITTLMLLALAIAAAVAAQRRRSISWLFVAGLCLGMTALTRPANLYLGYASALVGFGLVLWGKPRMRKLPLLLAFIGGLAMAVLPWIARNEIVLGRLALTQGYDSHTLVQRIAYNQMNWREYGLFYVCGLPDGIGLAKILFGPKACERFRRDPAATNSFYNIGNGPFMVETVTAAGGWSQHLNYVIRNYILASPLMHLLVTVPFALAGAWINHYWGLFLGIVCAVLTWRALRVGDKGLLVVTLPCWFMLLFHAGVAINQYRYNLILILPYSIAGAWLVERLLPARV
jgi:4-amino-4-deoxy-L-arabinose transferase-like glycosyltransferase